MRNANPGATRFARVTLDGCAIPSVTGDERAFGDDLRLPCTTIVGLSGVRRVGNTVQAWSLRRVRGLRERRSPSGERQ